MPIYEYRCTQCSAQFERLVQSTEDETELTCPSCGDRRVERILSMFSGSSGSSGTPERAAGCSQRKGFS